MGYLPCEKLRAEALLTANPVEHARSAEDLPTCCSDSSNPAECLKIKASAGISDCVAPPASKGQSPEERLNKLKEGNVAFNHPDKMKTGQTARITARIGSNEIPIAALEAGMTSNQDTKVETVSTPISLKMKMTLKSADFAITTLSSEEQGVFGDHPTEWTWDIVPKRSGKLHLHLAAIVELEDVSRDYATIDRDITVEVDPFNAVKEFVGKNWQWIIATLTAILGAAWKFLSSRKKSKTLPRLRPRKVKSTI